MALPHDFTAGDTLTAAQMDTIANAVVITTTSGARPGSPVQGMTIYQTDTNTYAVYGTAWCETTPYAATVATSEGTASTSYTDLATGGPAVTVTTGTKIILTVGAGMSSATAGAACLMAAAVSGATTRAAGDAEAVDYQVYASTGEAAQSKRSYISGLTAGANVVTSKYKNARTGGTATFVNRVILVEAIPT